MLTVDESIVINKPRTEVYEFMIDPDNVPVYSSNVVEYELVSGEQGQGRPQPATAWSRWRADAWSSPTRLVEHEPGRSGKTRLARTPRSPTRSR